MGTYLIFLAATRDEAYRQPIEALYLIRTIYFLVTRYPVLADLARAHDFHDVLTAALENITDPQSVPSRTGLSDEVTPHHLMITLLTDFLYSSGEKQSA
ncbi:hypothetical protein FGIG_10847 [Fasciola gigantica]|uniref:Uncharacterized protein n=1 Tax=Fasciola gigantica TaxID=46835 RepID=A0A504YGG5_FASGI|nr:hypothetical protein FGIG_10847 [Fasciola gigantica]